MGGIYALILEYCSTFYRLGGCPGRLAGALAVLTGQPPLKTMIDVADSIKIWAIAVALGGTLSSECLSRAFQGGNKVLIRQLVYLFAMAPSWVLYSSD